MSKPEEPKPAPGAENLPPLPAFPGREEDALFKAQMVVANAFYGYWRHGIAAMLAVLLGVLAWGIWSNHQTEQLQTSHAEVERVLRTLQAGIETHSDNPTMVKAQAAEGGRLLGEIGARTKGPGGTYAWVHAARAYQVAELPDKQLEAWTSAHERAEPGELGWASASGLSGVLVDQGKVDEAVAVLTQHAGARKDYPAQRSMYEAARFLELAGRGPEAAAAFEAFQTAYPESPLVSLAVSAAARLREQG